MNLQLYNFLGNVDNLFAHQKNKTNLKLFKLIFFIFGKKIEKKGFRYKKKGTNILK